LQWPSLHELPAQHWSPFVPHVASHPFFGSLSASMKPFAHFVIAHFEFAHATAVTFWPFEQTVSHPPQ
jgi:hypothetical protein